MNDDIKSLPNGDFYVVRKDKPVQPPPLKKPQDKQPIKSVRARQS